MILEITIGTLIGLAALGGVALAGITYLTDANHTLRKTYDESLPPADRVITREEQDRARTAMHDALEVSRQVADVTLMAVPGASEEAPNAGVKLAEGLTSAVNDFVQDDAVVWLSDPKNPLLKEGIEPTGGVLPDPFTFTVRLVNQDPTNPIHIELGTHQAGASFLPASRVDIGGQRLDVVELKPLKAQRFTAGRNTQIIATQDCIVGPTAPSLAKVVFNGSSLACVDWVP